jgi:hypothetical protein
MKTLARKSPKTEPFPEQRVRDSLIELWKVKVDERVDDPFAPKKRPNTLFDMLPALDSLEIVRSILTVEQIIDMEVPSNLIKRGGYRSGDEMIKHLMPKLKKIYETRSS